MSASVTDSKFVVCPWVMIIDTREQAPYSFRRLRTDANTGKLPLVVGIERQALPAGDYSIQGYESHTAVERKSLPDLFHCFGADRDRFERQVQRLSLLRHAAVVVEGGWPSVLRGVPNSKLSPKTVYRSVIAWQHDYPTVHWWMCPTRDFAERTTFRFLERFWKRQEKPKDGAKTRVGTDAVPATR